MDISSIAPARIQSTAVTDAQPVDEAPAAAPISASNDSSFDSTPATTVTAAEAPSSTSPTYRVCATGSGLVEAPASGAQLAYDALQFSERRLDSKSYQEMTWTFDGAPNKPLASAVKNDALAYIANTPGLSAACDQMVAASGAIPAKVDGLKVDFALNHFATVGAAAGEAWGATEADVKSMLASSAKDLATPPLVVKDTAGANGITLTGYVLASSHTFTNVDGSNNTIDLCTVPYPRPSGIGDEVLGGSKNTGQVDLVGTIVIKAGAANTWTLKDPSQRPGLNPPPSALAGLMRDQLAANAKQSDIVLEGSASDWSVTTNKDSATYVNAQTKTSVTIPAGAQGQVRYATANALEALTTTLKTGSVKKGVDPAPETPTPESAPRVPETLSKKTILLLLKKMGLVADGNASMEVLKSMLIKALQKPAAPSLANLMREEAQTLMASAQAASAKTPFDWFASHTGKTVKAEANRWAAEGKTTDRVRQELGEWQGKVISQMRAAAVLLLKAANALDSTDAGNNFTASA